MKTIPFLAVWWLQLGSAFSVEAPPQDWRSMKPEQLRAHVDKLTTFSEVEKLLGKASRPNQMGELSMYSYKVTETLRLSITCDDENILDMKKQVRAIRSIYLFERDANGNRIVWKIFTDPTELDEKFRSDRIDLGTQAEQAAS